MMPLKNKPVQVAAHITVRDHDAKVSSISFDDVVKFHQGDSWFGCAAGFRAMQKAAGLLFTDHILDRGNLYIVSGHPGPGVRDAIEVITRCVSSNRYQLLDKNNTQGCNRDMRFEWWVSNGRQTAHVQMSDDIVADEFFDIAERITNDKGSEDDKHRFGQLKIELRDHLMSQTLGQGFSGNILHTPLSPGVPPDA